ncbi:RNA-binding protein L isoform X4 [Prosopis cineraria]|uniref:RNA-binding protein L isoform X4 n=1 Tax=Prosopis cineraria TaxID=364024 RepID=UPI00240EA7B7|nr:RNA-binding protein L isoform X4 [Prosopis cineraria]
MTALSLWNWNWSLFREGSSYSELQSSPMDDMAAYYTQSQPSTHHTFPYYQHPHPSSLAVVPPPPGAAAPPVPPHLPSQYGSYQQPLFSSYGPPNPLQYSADEVRTLFIAGLPEDVKPREIYNLFREFPGYESSHLRSPTESSQAFAFAVFSNQQSALMAMHALNGMVFDLEEGSTLYIDLAKSNSRSKRTRLDDEIVGSDKKARGSSFSAATPDSAGVGSIHMPGMGNSAYNTNTPWYVDGKAFNDSAAPNLSNSSRIPQNATPCPTLFVANLGPSCTEQELMQVFSRCPGFLKLKMQSTYGAPVAFVDFQDVASSTGALNSLQGTVLFSSAAGEGMRLAYAKSRMGMRKKPK